MIRCSTCPRRLTESEQLCRLRRCSKCRAHAKRRQGRKPSDRQRFTINPERAAKRGQKVTEPGDSFWTKYATGPRNDADYMDEAQRRHPERVTSSQVGLLLKPLVKGAA